MSSICCTCPFGSRFNRLHGSPTSRAETMVLHKQIPALDMIDSCHHIIYAFIPRKAVQLSDEFGIVWRVLCSMEGGLLIVLYPVEALQFQGNSSKERVAMHSPWQLALGYLSSVNSLPEPLNYPNC